MGRHVVSIVVVAALAAWAGGVARGAGPKDGKATERWPDGKVRAEGQYKSQRRAGRWVFWHNNGKKWAEGEYANGLKEGQWRYLD